jgi:hypothetical protein
MIKNAILYPPSTIYNPSALPPPLLEISNPFTTAPYFRLLFPKLKIAVYYTEAGEKWKNLAPIQNLFHCHYNILLLRKNSFFERLRIRNGYI